MLRSKTSTGILLLSAATAVGLLIALYAGTSQENELTLDGVALPRAPDYPPATGDHVSLGEAIDRSPYTLPIPDVFAAREEPSNIWVSRKGSKPESHRVYLVYDSGLRVSAIGQTPAIDYSERETGSFRPARVRGIPAIGRDADDPSVRVDEAERVCRARHRDAVW